MAEQKKPIVQRLRWGEDILALTVFFLLAFLPAFETISRLFGGSSIPSSPVLVQHMTLWIGFVGAVLATRQNKLLALTTKPLFQADEEFHFGRWIAKNISFIVIISLMWGSWSLFKVEFQYPVDIAPNIPRWFAQVIMPVGFTLMAIQVFYSSFNNRMLRSSMLMMAVMWMFIAFSDAFNENSFILFIGCTAILISLYYGAPIFVGLGGIAGLLFWSEYLPVAAIPAEAYRIVVSPSLPTIPLFTLAGYILAESGSSERMFKVFRVLFGWIPGGTPIVIVFLSGFFTALTGGSGVTILALGGLLYPLLRKEGYNELFSLGLITVAGSLGLLFPPSLPAILFGVTAGVSVKDIFIAGFIPGIILVLAVASWAIFQEKRQDQVTQSINMKNIGAALWEAKWEMLIPFLVLLGIFGGFTTLVETAALMVFYTFVIEVFVYKDLKMSEFPRIVLDCATLIGGVLIILGVAMGLTSYLVDAQIPSLLLDWVKSTISSKFIFLFMLNILLLVVGCLMDIFSAIIVIVPLIMPLGIHFGIDPVHLGIIFIANLELGFLTPPVGINLFLSAYRFNKDMPTIYKATLPFFLIRFVVVLLITYIPIISLGLLN
ncbi:MAG: TRAP transporter large permease subunit [Candidatus Marinimicrobia bacterium]|jgi:tripartite ATP-independent transporter DctM subunit|nr:C4-dicarboxylate ABC transporter permease [Candidatus Neomarinimicrobiota bacterium]MAH03155.1 C4-dicarboxylate ABC transporter permease [Candidatus Pelagibacter sp.]MDP6500139.1 TRAP transporter large permease subunit [Candidatus Neomarinimicrobiota bacterium]MDP6726457.1 TRAP transporter large permease subunit [Candidatus Neomarinimicrobiota bacterium]|tara:strand:- start:31324 stop:33132 length:1809 start_codon:yes stop_codon:yes gene_type:complete